MTNPSTKTGAARGQPDPGDGSDPINRVFAAVQQTGVRIGVTLVVVGFALYASGLMAPYLSIEVLTRNWGMASAAFIEHTGMPRGWEWVWLLGYSDILALAGLVLLTSVIVVAYAFMAVLWARQRNLKYLLLSILQLGVFVLAASGLLGGGH